MSFFYRLGIGCYHLLVRIAALWNGKAKKWVDGRTGVLERIRQEITGDKPRIWFHCASLGEFEQGRPIIEAFSRQHSGFEVVLTFYSPSGYEVRKNYAGAQHIFYLPADGPANARAFLDAVQPALVVFVKYEYWYFYLSELQKRQIPTYLASAIFRQSQPFFAPLVGRWFRKLLGCFDWIFVQDTASGELLSQHGITHVSQAGDTRFDRVYEIARAAKPVPQVAIFKAESLLLVAGSTWPADEKILAQTLPQLPAQCKLLIAPHEPGNAHVEVLLREFDGAAVRLSQATESELVQARVLLIDSIGLLSAIYRYADAAYVGGGFGAGIHNVPEAAAWGVPVVFGPRHKKFREAVDLIRLGAAFGPETGHEISNALMQLMSNLELRSAAGQKAAHYVEQETGATGHILDHFNKLSVIRHANNHGS